MANDDPPTPPGPTGSGPAGEGRPGSAGHRNGGHRRSRGAKGEPHPRNRACPNATWPRTSRSRPRVRRRRRPPTEGSPRRRTDAAGSTSPS